MSDCCSKSTAPTSPSRHRCPVNGREYARVLTKTILHHLRQPWHWQGNQQGYYFCDDPDCDVVYFADDDSTILQRDIRTPVGIKGHEKNATLCYCFGVSFADAQQDEGIKAFVSEQTRQQICQCEARNPSGKCCLKDFPRQN